MRIILAPDSFKGSLSAEQACDAMRLGVLRAAPSAETVSIPLADGGEGTAEALVAATGGRMCEVPATGPLGERLTGRLGLLGDGRTAVLEMACVSGLPLVPPEKRNPLHTTTYGTGELIAAALSALERAGAPAGQRRVLVGIGGSATTDCGAGMAQALGARFVDGQGQEIRDPMTGGRLAEVARVDLSGLNPRLREARIEVACDVDNPLLGPRGSAAVYGPQKGATPEIVRQLEANLAHAIGIIERAVGRAVRDVPGAGAAGGLGAGLLATLDAELRPGVQIVLSACRFSERLLGTELVLTGEGRIDAQTAFGKTISGVARAARAAGVPVIALVGAIGPGTETLYELGLTSVFTIVPGPVTLEEAMAGGQTMLADAAERAVRAFQAGRLKG